MNCLLCEKNSEDYIKIKDYTVCTDCYVIPKNKRIITKFINSLSKGIEEQEKALKSFNSLVEKSASESNKEELLLKVTQKYGNNIMSKERLVKSIQSLSDEEVSHLSEKVSHNNLKDLKNGSDIPFYNPKEIKSKMDEVIIGQERAKFDIANALSVFSCREKDKRIQKPNIFISGPTGTGKTEFSRFISKELKLPLVTIDATLLTSTGYEGLSVNDLLFSMLITKNNGDIKKCENSIVFIDEIDKKTKGMNVSEVGTITVQMELLRILEDGYVQGVYNKEKYSIRTQNIIFIVAGAFTSIQNDFSSLQDYDLLKVGIMPEFLGRFSTVTATVNLTKKELKEILTKKKNNVLFTNKLLFKKYNVNLEFSESFIDEVIEETLTSELGVRSLNRIVSEKMKDILFNVFDYYNKTIKMYSDSKIKVIN